MHAKVSSHWYGQQEQSAHILGEDPVHRMYVAIKPVEERMCVGREKNRLQSKVMYIVIYFCDKNASVKDGMM